MSTRPAPKPKWLKAPLPGGERFNQVKRATREYGLSTVCEEARCPNMGECWSCGTATFMILGDTCTRGCSFCAVKTAPTPAAPESDEPGRVAHAVQKMGLEYVVITSVTRDDISDGGADAFARTIKAVRNLPSAPMVEVLTSDYLDDNLQTVLNAKPTVFAHNIEIVERLSPGMRHHRFDYRRSLSCLEQAAACGRTLTKSSIMLGLGESRDEVRSTMGHLRNAGVKILVLGQYLQPTPHNAKVERYVPPEEFDTLAAEGKQLGFEFVAAGPLVRTSYKAAEAYVKSRDAH